MKIVPKKMNNMMIGKEHQKQLFIMILIQMINLNMKFWSNINIITLMKKITKLKLLIEIIMVSGNKIY
jgi:hypothetical protein